MNPEANKVNGDGVELNGKHVSNGTQTTRKEISNFRRILPQFLATSAKNLILLDLGMTMAFPTIVIPVLSHADYAGNMKFDSTLASWFGSIAFICQPIGSIISGTVLEPLGRRNSMLIINIPHLLGWYLYYVADSLWVIFVAVVVMGLGVGFMEAPVITYVGEICEPRLRGILTSYSGIFVTLGLVFGFLLGTLFHWQQAAFISSFIPIITFVAISQVPETPMWLLSKGRVKDAEKALCWLRGWVSPEYVQEELQELMRYNDASKLVLKEKKPKAEKIQDENHNKNIPAYANPIPVTDDLPGADVVDKSAVPNSDVKDVFHDVPLPELERGPVDRKATKKELLRDLVRPQMMKPFLLVLAFFVFHNSTGIPAVRAYMVDVFETLRFPIDAHWATVLVSMIGVVGIITCMIAIKFVGKRVLSLVSMVGCAFSLLSLTLWCYFNENSADKSPVWFPFLMFTFLSYCFSFGMGPIPWVILSEIFPFRGRGFASGLAAAASYILGFLTSKTFLDLEKWFGLKGVFLLYGTITTFGTFYLYFKLPETEGKSLQDIEDIYKKSKKPETKGSI